MSASTVVVAGALASKPGNGGEAWVRTSWTRGLLDLGCDAWLVEELATGPASDVAGAVAWFGDVTAKAGLADRAVLVGVDPAGRVAPLVSPPDIATEDVLAEAELLVNISGNVRHRDLLRLPRRRAYVDLDPGFTQIWAASDIADLGLAAHELHFTVGELIGTPACPLPTAGHRWRPCRQPVVLDEWPVSPLPDNGPMTTVATWRCPFGPLTWDGTTYGLKLHEFRAVAELPTLVDASMELALDVHHADDADRGRLVELGWTVRDGRAVTATPDAFASYVRSSRAEFSVAQGVYAHGRTGWFSDRTVRYLASGRPAILQDTGWPGADAADGGVVMFAGLDQAAAAVACVTADIERHAVAARRIAEEHFASDVVLTRFLEDCDVAA